MVLASRAFMRGEPITQPQLQLENPRKCFRCAGFVSRGFSHINKSNILLLYYNILYICRIKS